MLVHHDLQLCQKARQNRRVIDRVGDSRAYESNYNVTTRNHWKIVASSYHTGHPLFT